MTQPDVIIVGGGIVGAACARAIALTELTVTLLDYGEEPGNATPAAAGMLAPLAETGQDDPLLSLSVLARDLYQELVPELIDRTGIVIPLWNHGILQVAFDDDDAAHLKGQIAWQRQQGFKSDWVTAEELREDYPGLSTEIVGGMLAPEDGALEPNFLYQALLKDAETMGADVQRGVRVEGVTADAGRVTGVRSADRDYASERVIISAGAWSGQIQGLPRPLTVVPIRGQMAALPWPDDEPPAIVYSGRGYVTFRQGEALAGSTMEHVGFNPATTPEGIEGILDRALRIYPALDRHQIKRTWSGLRPVTPDGNPIVGPDSSLEGLWYATGHGRNGILLAGLTAQLIAQQLVGEEIEHDLRPLDPARFWRW